MKANKVLITSALLADENLRQLAILVGKDRLTVIGGLVEVWLFAGSKPIPGLMEGAALNAIDVVAGIDGFGTAMRMVGWAKQTESGVEIPDYEATFGRVARRRLADRIRKVSARKAENVRKKADNVRKKSGQKTDDDEKAEFVRKKADNVRQKSGRNADDVRKKADEFRILGGTIGGESSSSSSETSVCSEDSKKEETSPEGVSFPKKAFQADKAPVPENLNTPEFLSVWALWIAHRKEMGKKLTPTAVGQQLKKMAKWGPQRAIVAIEHSISASYQGIFEPLRQAGATVPALTPEQAARKAHLDEINKIMSERDRQRDGMAIPGVLLGLSPRQIPNAGDQRHLLPESVREHFKARKIEAPKSADDLGF